MKFNVEKKQSIILYLLEKIKNGDKSVTKKVSDTFDINQTTVHTYANELIKEGVIIKAGRDKYELVSNVHKYHLERAAGELEMDDRVYLSCMDPHVSGLPENVRRIWGYAFSEMINNVIDHSGSPSADIIVRQDYLSTLVIISDNGVGIFKKIKEYFNLATLDEAISELFKGKLTTDSEHHPGEGIFFSSRMMDEFAVVSSGKVFSHSKYETIASSLNSIKELKGWDNLPGTIVFMKLSNYSKREIGEVFRAYEDEDYDFIRTIVPVKNLFDSFPVSRSQAKRLCKGFERFKEVILDFRDVEMTGQGFADEIFRVYVNHNPDVKISYINACNEVERMIRHVESRTF